MDRSRFPDRPSVQSVVEEQSQSASPVSSNRENVRPTSGTFQLIGRKVKGVDQLNLRRNHVSPDGGNALVPVELVKQEANGGNGRECGILGLPNLQENPIGRDLFDHGRAAKTVDAC